MPRLCVALILVALAISLPMTLLMRRLGTRLRALDGAGIGGQVKAAPREVPNTGGVAIFAAICIPMLVGLALAHLGPPDLFNRLWPALPDHLAGIRQKTQPTLLLIACVGVLHVIGVFDDRRPLGAMPKLLLMVGTALAVTIGTESRLMELLDAHVGGAWLSILLTVVWIVVITNAFNFLDNMDGLSGGVAIVASACFLGATLINGQWFIAACLSLLIGALAGFLCFNFPLRKRASIFMGDGGSLVVGFMLGVLTVRTTYVGASGLGSGWYGVFMPLVVLAIPLYDAISVTIIRISQGRSPLVGDLQHFSHRLVNLGLSQRAAVGVICACTAATAIGGISLARLTEWQAMLVGVQTLLILGTLATFEWRGARRASGAA